MRKRKFLLVLIAIILISVSSCKKENGNPASTATPETVTTPTKEPGPTPKPITEDEKGKPHPQAEVLLKEDFEDGEINPDEFMTLYDEYIKISDGYMNITEVWSAVLPQYAYSLATLHNQYEFSATFSISHLQPDAPHIAYWVGARVPQEGYGAYPGGIWLAFNYTNQVRVYLSGDNFIDDKNELIKEWDKMFFTITAPESFKEEHTVTVIDTGDEILYYMNTKDEENYLLIRAVLDGSDLIIYDKNGKNIFNGENAINDLVNFSIFSHRTKSHTDEIVLKAY